MTAADWTSHPEDLAYLINYLHSQRSRAGDGGNFTGTVFAEAATLMAKECPPKKGGPKTAKSIATKWKSLGFNVTPESQDAWDTFIKAHPHFRHFATSGWVHFHTVGEIVPSRARGRHVFNAASSQLAATVGLALQSQDDPDDPDESQDLSQLSQSGDSSQPLTEWSQTDFGGSQPDGTPNSDQTPSSQFSATQSAASQPAATQSAASQPAATQSAASQLVRVPVTPATAMKRTASDDIEPPWSNKRNRGAMGPESLLALGRSVDGIGRVIATVLAPKVSSAMSPTKKVENARNLAREDAENGYLSGAERTKLHILFGRDTTAADAYISDDDAFTRADIGRELLNPAPIY
ncbi:hypothetical protein C8R45DRAFT_1090879 [Mycena sanguinolenta]|nr:hypothetical protein C8R45DRAFT_1090879 [Mycena sanguinolenta]